MTALDPKRSFKSLGPHALRLQSEAEHNSFCSGGQFETISRYHYPASRRGERPGFRYDPLHALTLRGPVVDLPGENRHRSG